jgi:hypothetical protein
MDWFSDSQILSEDKVLNVVHNLKEDPYRFSSETGTFNATFCIALHRIKKHWKQ